MTVTDDTELREAVENVIEEWVDTAYRTASAGVGNLGCEAAMQEAFDQMRHLHLAEPWHPATAILALLTRVEQASPDRDVIAKALLGVRHSGPLDARFPRVTEAFRDADAIVAALIASSQTGGESPDK